MLLGRTMPLDEANALVELLLHDETAPDRRAKLIALRLALGYPHALEVQPEQLAELRQHELGPSLVLQSWLAGASAIAFVWYAGLALVVANFDMRDPHFMLEALIAGMVGAIAGLVLASLRPLRRPLRVLSWAWLFAAGYVAALAIGSKSPDSGLAAAMIATPSMLVSLAASRVARHSAAR